MERTPSLASYPSQLVPTVEGHLISSIGDLNFDLDVCVDALADITMAVFVTEVVGLVGPSGSGKSTLLNVVGCVTEPSLGWMRLNGDTVYDRHWLRRDLRRLRLEKIGFIFQTHNLLPFLTAVENVMEVMEFAGARPAEARRRTVEILEYLEVGHRPNALPAQLSGGEAQRVAIARALANRPKIILADEPTAPLDSIRAGIVIDLLRRIATERAATILVVSHDEKIFDRFDRILYLRDGRLVDTGYRPQLSNSLPIGHSSARTL